MADYFELQAELQKTPQTQSWRYHGFVSGNITNVNDDQGLVRVKARIGAMADNEESDWLIPAFPGSIECKPSKGDPCIVGFLDGDPNRGFWLYHPESTTKQRPSEAMALGTTLAGVVNQIQQDLKTLLVAYNNQTYVNGGHPTTVVIKSDQIQASDGSAVPARAGQNVALSGLCRVK